MRNTKQLTIRLDEAGLKMFKNTPSIKQMLHSDQVDKLSIGDNIVNVGYYIYSRLQSLSVTLQPHIQIIS